LGVSNDTVDDWKAKYAGMSVGEAQPLRRRSDEREEQPGKDGGYLWRMETWWRTEERDGGVCRARAPHSHAIFPLVLVG
jgi:hypothetical protein